MGNIEHKELVRYIYQLNSLCKSMTKMEARFHHLLLVAISLQVLSSSSSSSSPSNTKKFHFNVSYSKMQDNSSSSFHIHTHMGVCVCVGFLFIYMFWQIRNEYFSGWVEEYNKALPFEAGVNGEWKISWSNYSCEWRWQCPCYCH